MQYGTFDIRRSKKAHIEAPEHFIVVREKTVYLRILGQEGAYIVMTATSGEDSGHYLAYGDQLALHQAAIVVARHIDAEPIFKADFDNRPYVEVCQCEFLSDAYRAAALLFECLMPKQ